MNAELQSPAVQKLMTSSFLAANPHRTTCYHLFSALARGFRAPKTAFVLGEVPNKAGIPSWRVMPIYDILKNPKVPHDSLKERIKGLKRSGGDPERIAYLQTELDARRAGNPTPDFQLTP